MPRKISAAKSSRSRRSDSAAASDPHLARVHEALAALASTRPVFVRRALDFLSMKVGWSFVESIDDGAPEWRPEPVALVVMGDLVTTGNVLLKTRAKKDDTFLLVLGDLRCKNLTMGTCGTLLCAGALSASQKIDCNAADSTTLVAGRVTAKVVSSGKGAWLAVEEAAQLVAKRLDGYVMAGGRPLRAR